MSILICICSKYPNHNLYECINELYKIQINTSSDFIYKIHVVDSDSDNFIYYNKIVQDFPDVEIHMIKNKNYEYGAWKYILEKYPSFDIYFCIQDTNIINKYIDLNKLDDKTAYTFHNHSGYNSHISIKEIGIENLKNSGLNYHSIIDTDFNLAQHSSFIVKNITMKNIFKHLNIPPINKEGSCFYERNFGIYFVDKGINTINLYDFMSKINGGRGDDSYTINDNRVDTSNTIIDFMSKTNSGKAVDSDKIINLYDFMSKTNSGKAVDIYTINDNRVDTSHTIIDFMSKTNGTKSGASTRKTTLIMN